MTKTESAEHLVKTLAIESCEQWLEFHAAGGVRAAIPNTPNLIMVGPADWIAKNVPGVEELIVNDSSMPVDMTQAKRWITGLRGRVDDLLGIINESPELASRLAATTQASTAQAEPVAWMTSDKRMLIFAHVLKGNLDTTTEGMTPLYAATSSTDSALADAEARDAAHSWAEGERIANVPIVEDSLRGFSEDPTSDNGVCVVIAVLDALRSATATGSGADAGGNGE